MCTRPLEKDGNIFSCRTCNECVATRRSDWVSRAMAEKASNAHALVFTLTYGSEMQFQRDGAAMFRYADIRALLSRLRRQIFYHTGVRSAVRFICAGEQGERNGRCHWHIVLFSSVDLTTIGRFSYRPNPESRSEVFVTKREHIVSLGKKKLRRNWSLWPHGMILIQEPDQGGMSYALSYALKDQFTIEKSQGTMREGKVEKFATGLFRMSKTPPIGADYLDNQLANLAETGSVFPRLRITIPDMTGYWVPSGTMRKRLLAGLRQINDTVRAATGRNAPQWSSLLAGCAENVSDMECLTGEPETQETPEDFAREVSIRQREGARSHRIRETARRCGSTDACNACLAALSDTWLREGLQIETFTYTFLTGETETRFRYIGEESGDRLAAAQRDAASPGVNPYCQNRKSALVLEAFPSSAVQPPDFGPAARLIARGTRKSGRKRE